MGGLSTSNRNNDNQYAVGDLVDPFRDWGYLKPALAGSALSVTIIDGQILDMAYYSSTISYLGAGVKVHKLDTGALVNTGVFPYTVTTAAPTVMGTVLYSHKVGGTIVNSLFYIQNLEVGRYDLASTFDDDWMKNVPASGAQLTTSSFHPYTLWNGHLIIGNARYVARYDGQTGDNGTFTAQYFDCGDGFAVYGFFKYLDYLGIIAFKNQTSSDIILIDGSSATQAIKRITVNKGVRVGANVNDTLLFLTEDIAQKGWLEELGSNNLDPLFETRFENKDTAGTFDTYRSPNDFRTTDIYDNKLAFAPLSNRVFVIGKKDTNSPFIFTKPFISAGTTISCIKWIDAGTLYIASYTGATYYLEKFTTGNAAATLKYCFKDMGQKVKINYVEFYFKKLVASDSLTAGIETNYDTANTLGIGTGNISYTKDGAVTFKKFIKSINCHSFRPTVIWGAGGTSIAKVVVDFSYISD